MRSQSNLTLPILFALALAGVSTLAGARTADCLHNFCLRISLSSAQQNVGRGPITTMRDPELEKQYEKSLEAARFYLERRLDKKNKENSAARLKAIQDRLLEILDVYPQFSKIDQVYFLLGESYYRGGETDKAVEYLSRVVSEFPESKVSKEAKKRLDELRPQKESKKES